MSARKIGGETFYNPLGDVNYELMGIPGQGTHDFNETQYNNWQSDWAVDMGVPEGTPIFAPFSGEIVSINGSPDGSSRTGGYGLGLQGENGYCAYLKHLISKSVKKGDKVKGGQKVGKSGSGAGVPHLHFALAKTDKYSNSDNKYGVDPRKYLNGASTDVDTSGSDDDSGGEDSRSPLKSPSGYPDLLSSVKGTNENVIRQVPMEVDTEKVQINENYYNAIEFSQNFIENPYFGQGVYDPEGYGEKYRKTYKINHYSNNNYCTFSYLDKRGGSKSISLIVPPHSISWSYSLRTSVEDTYGGQVIQILGVQIDNFKLSGYIPRGFWGLGNNYFNEATDKEYYTGEDDAFKNGIVHLANFFRDFFAAKTQNSFTTENMKFEYPHYGWTGAKAIAIIPFEFPRVRLANDEILPEWELECSVVEYKSSHFEGAVSKAAKDNLKDRFNNLGEGVGFAKFIEWSDPSATSSIEVTEQAKKLGASYANFVKNFNPQESGALAQAGFSYPPDVSQDVITAKVEEVKNERFGIG